MSNDSTQNGVAPHLLCDTTKTYTAAAANWLVQELAPAVLAVTGLTDDAADLDQLPELTPAMLTWPGLLDRASRIFTCAAAVLVETFLAEHRARPRRLIESEYDVLCAGIGAQAL